MNDAKRIAVIVRDRQSEALRIAGGLTLADDAVEIFILDHTLDRSDQDIVTPLELITELDLKVYSNKPENGFTTISLEEMAQKLLAYDHVVPY